MDSSKNIVNAIVDHIYWTNDSLVFKFLKSKIDRFVKNVDKCWHVYATLNNPTTFLVLSIA